MNRRLLAPLLALALLEYGPASAAPTGHCAPYTVTPVAGDPFSVRIQTARGTTVARRYAPIGPDRAPTAAFAVYRNFFDYDHDTTTTIRDTIVVTQGATVRWTQYQPDFHTVTKRATSFGTAGSASGPRAPKSLTRTSGFLSNCSVRIVTTSGSCTAYSRDFSVCHGQ